MSGAAALTPFFYRRDFSLRALPPPGAWQVLSCDWRAVGGPGRAVLVSAVTQDLAAPWQDLLRCPVELLDTGGCPAWWGFVSTVELRAGGVRLRYSLDGFYNSVRVDYRLSAGGDWVHSRAKDLESMAEWGEKEFFYLGKSNLDYFSAAATARGTLALLNRIEKAAEAGAPEGAPVVRLELRGWWDTLGWRYWQWGGEGVDAWDIDPVVAARIGYSTADAKKAQGFDGRVGLPGRVQRVRFSLAKVGAPSDKIRLSINPAGADTQPSATMLDYIDIEAASLSEQLAWYEFEFPNLAALIEPGQMYYYVIQRTGSYSTTNYCTVGVQELPAAIPGVRILKQLNAGEWLTRQPLAVAARYTTLLTETSAAMAYLAASSRGGQFLTGAQIDTGEGVWVELARSDARHYQAEIEAMLRMGTADGRRLLAEIDAGRALRVAPAPVGEASLLIDPDGRLLDLDGSEIGPSARLVGQWARCLTWPDAPALFIERARYDGRSGRIHIAG